jgi:hypothetical protein
MITVALGWDETDSVAQFPLRRARYPPTGKADYRYSAMALLFDDIL